MMVRLNRESKGSARVLRGLQTVGIVNAGLTMQVRRLCCPGGHVCVLKTEERLVVPTDVGGVVELARIVMSMLQVKEMIGECEKMLRERGCAKTVEEALGEEGEKVDLRWFVDTDPESRG